jgi:hypothetical protein
MTRQEGLLRKAADAFGEVRDPFAHDWLSENQVTLDECMTLSEQIGVIIYGYLAVPKEVRNRVSLAGACAAAGLPAEVTVAADNNVRMNQLREAVDALRQSVGSAGGVEPIGLLG